MRTLPSDWRDNYKRDTRFWNNQTEYTKVAELEEERENMREARQSNCYYGVDGGEFKSFDDKQDNNMKMWAQWKAAFDPNDPRPNLKSTFVYNAVQTAMTEVYDASFMPSVVGWTKKGIKVEQEVENIVKYPIIRYGFDIEWKDAIQEALIGGNAFLKINYEKIVVTKKIKKLKDFSKEELKKLEKMGEIAIYQDRQIIQHNDVIWTHIPFNEYYPDPYARKQHGLNHAATKGLHEYVISYDNFKARFGNRRGFINIDKVRPGSDRMEDNPIFKFPEDHKKDNNVVVRELEDLGRDFTRYTANGVWLADIPIDNHKELSVVHIGCVKFPNQYYYLGLGDVIEGLQVEDEVMRNKFIELLELNLTPPIIANNQVAGEFKEQYETARYNIGDIISISGSPQEIQFMAPAISKLSELFGMRAQIKEDVISVSLIDPRASSQPSVRSETATETVAMMQATMKSFAMTMKTVSQGLNKGLNIQWALQRQEYPLTLEPEEIEKRKGDKSESQAKGLMKSREIFSQDVLIVENKDKYEVKKTPGKLNPFYIKDEYLDLEDGDVNVIITAESLQPLTKVSKIRKTEQALSQLFPILAQDAQMKGIPPLEYGPIQVLLKDYVIAHGNNEDILEFETEDKEESIERSIEQHQQIYKNAELEPSSPGYKMVLGCYDEPKAHTNEHLRALQGINALVDKVKMERDSTMAETVSMIETGQQPNEAVVNEISDLQAKLGKLERIKVQLEEHLEVDRMTEEQGTEKLLLKETGLPQQGLSTAGAPQMGAQMGGENMMPPSGVPAVPGPVQTGQQDLSQMGL